MTVTEGPRCGQDHMTRSYDPAISVTVMPALVRELKEAETEWAQRGYPKIRWRRLSPRLQKFSPALLGVLNGNSPSFYRTELESAIARKEDRKYRRMENSTAGYYGPRGQQIL